LASPANPQPPSWPRANGSRAPPSATASVSPSLAPGSKWTVPMTFGCIIGIKPAAVSLRNSSRALEAVAAGS